MKILALAALTTLTGCMTGSATVVIHLETADSIQVKMSEDALIVDIQNPVSETMDPTLSIDAEGFIHKGYSYPDDAQ